MIPSLRGSASNPPPPPPPTLLLLSQALRVLRARRALQALWALRERQEWRAGERRERRERWEQWERREQRDNKKFEKLRNEEIPKILQTQKNAEKIYIREKNTLQNWNVHQNSKRKDPRTLTLVRKKKSRKSTQEPRTQRGNWRMRERVTRRACRNVRPALCVSTGNRTKVIKNIGTRRAPQKILNG